jgi:lambda repressor-like predicted transcriptional regulator
MSENAADKFQSMANGLASTGMPLRQIARESQLSAATVHRALHGDTRMPSADSFAKLESLWKKRGMP